MTGPMTYGFDASTSVVGYAAIVEAGRLFLTGSISLKDVEDLADKADLCFERLIDLPQIETSVHVIEDRLGGFTRGLSNMNTLMRLGAWNAVFSYTLRLASGVRPLHVHPSTVKSTMRKLGLDVPKGADKKEMTLDWVAARFPDFEVKRTRTGKPRPEMYDIADGTCLALHGRQTVLS